MGPKPSLNPLDTLPRLPTLVRNELEAKVGISEPSARIRRCVDTHLGIGRYADRRRHIFRFLLTDRNNQQRSYIYAIHIKRNVQIGGGHVRIRERLKVSRYAPHRHIRKVG